MSDMPNPDQQPEAALIERRRKAQRPILSVRKAAEMAGMSEGRWRQIVLGYQSAAGHKIPVVGPAETIQRMLDATGSVSAKELEELNEYRPDVAALYRLNTGSGTVRWGGTAVGVAPPDPLELLRRARNQIDEAIAALEGSRDAQEPEPQQGAGGASGGGESGASSPIVGSPEGETEWAPEIPESPTQARTDDSRRRPGTA